MTAFHKHICNPEDVSGLLEKEESQGYWIDPELSKPNPCSCCGMCVLVFKPQD